MAYLEFLKNYTLRSANQTFLNTFLLKTGYILLRSTEINTSRGFYKNAKISGNYHQKSEFFGVTDLQNKLKSTFCRNNKRFPVSNPTLRKSQVHLKQRPLRYKLYFKTTAIFWAERTTFFLVHPTPVLAIKLIYPRHSAYKLSQEYPHMVGQENIQSVQL